MTANQAAYSIQLMSRTLDVSRSAFFMSITAVRLGSDRLLMTR